MNKNFSQIGNVPCGGCTRCCQGDAVQLLPGDDLTQYETEPHAYRPGQLMLKIDRTRNACVYLGDGECTIYDRRPRMCREADCRVMALRLTYTNARKMSRFANGRMMAIYRRGKEMQRNFPLWKTKNGAISTGNVKMPGSEA